MGNITDNITVNTHSSIRIEGSKVIYVDPFRITGTSHDADIIFITHSHYDHLDPDSIKAVEKDDTVFVGPESISMEIKSVAGTHAFIPVAPEGSYTAGGISFSTTPAYNKIKPFHPKRGRLVGYIITMDDASYYIAGDTDALDVLRKVSCDAALIPIGGTYTMTAKDAASLINSIRPRFAIPIHYGSIVGSPEDALVFKKNVDDGIEVVIKLA